MCLYYTSMIYTYLVYDEEAMDVCLDDSMTLSDDASS